MDFLNQAVAQLRELFQSMTPAARITAVLLLGVIGVSLGYLVQQNTGSPGGYLFNGELVPAYDIDRAAAAIAQAGLKGHQREGNHIRVPRGRKPEFLAAVADAGALPRNFHKIMTDALDPSPFASGDTRRQKLKAAREQQLSMLISAMDGIEIAHVVYDVREARGLARKGQATATVSVRPESGEMLGPRHAKMIKRAVAGAIVGLGMADVTVTNLSDGSQYGSDGGISVESFDDPYFRNRLAYEEWMANKVKDLLNQIPGVTVQITAELEEVVERTVRTTKPEGEAATLRQVEEIEENETAEINNGGRPGISAQGPNRNDPVASQVTVKNTNTKSRNQNDFQPGIKDEFVREAPLVPRDVRASIAIPNAYLLSIWQEQERKKGNEEPGDNIPNTALTTIKKDVIDTVKGTVAPLFPKEQADYEFDKVSVQFFESLTPDSIEGPTTSSQAIGWAAQNFNTLTMSLFALVGLIMLRSIVKSVPSQGPVPTAGASTLSVEVSDSDSGEEQSSESESADDGRPKLKLNKGPNLKDDLTEMVREDPDAATAILRGWIDSAA